MNDKFLKLVAAMRAAQKEYFLLSGKAKRSHHPDDFAAAKTKLAQSKVLEGKVDAFIISQEKPTTTLS
jgi:hypothetical protein